MSDTVTKYGRDFEFDAGVPEDVRHQRIDKWMQQNAPDEIQTPTEERAPPAATSSTPRDQSKLDTVARMLDVMSPGLSKLIGPATRGMTGDANYYRTVAQGAIPFADEATAGVRSILPGGPSYDTALGEERQGVKDFTRKYGPEASTLAELTGAGLGMGAGVGAAKLLKGVPYAGPAMESVGNWIMKNPWKAAPAVGGGVGAVSGFGAGEDGIENRVQNAGEMGLIGAMLGTGAHAGVGAVDKILGYLNTDNRVANLLRKRLKSDREGLALSPTDTNDPNFTAEAMRNLRAGMREQQNANTRPMVADLLPGASEMALQSRGPETEQLARNFRKRQYDESLPQDTASGLGQYGRVGDAFDLAFGPDTFTATDKGLLAQRKANADQLFKPSYEFNIRSQGIDDALNKLNTLDPTMYAKVWDKSKRAMEAEHKVVGGIDATGNLRSYNTEFLHNIKRELDAALGEEGLKNPKFNQVPYLSTKRELNEAMKAQNPAYKGAMERFGEDSDLERALQKGRTEAFPSGSVDVQGGMKAKDIEDYLKDPDVTAEQKSLFKQGAARALREKFLASNTKKFSHNWADFVNNPEVESRMGAMFADNPNQLNSWTLLRSALKKESENYQGASRATGNSRTAVRQAMKEELGGSDNLGKIAGSLTNPLSFGGIKNFADAGMSALGIPDRVANRTANLLSRQGTKGTSSALREIEAMLSKQDARRALYQNIGARAPAAAAYAWPYREE